MNAKQAVQQAYRTPNHWQGDGKHDDQVVYANGTFSVGSNGDAQDFATAAEAAAALTHEWKQQDKHGK